MLYRIFIFSILILSIDTLDLWAQSKTIITPPDYIKSIVFRSTNTNDYAPIIKLGSSIMLEFDDLEGDQKQYYYKIEHYDYNWEKSSINTTEYLDGFSSDWIRNFENSFNSLQGYTHYRMALPNDNMRLKISGNYLISVYNEEDEIVFTRPFIVYQPLVNVGVSVHRSREISSINSKQNVQFSINHPNLLINNPSVEIKVAVYQNNDWNTVMRNIKPQFIRGSQLLYRYGANLNYWAGNEFLFFDTKQIRNGTNNILRSELKNIFNTYLYTDEVRSNQTYTNYPDVNGNFVLRTLDADDINTEGDYSWVHFTLETSKMEDDVFIYGDFNDWQLTDANKMTYDASNGIYFKKLLLKQGFYNYKYVVKDLGGNINNDKIGGSFYQTENNYTVIVYYKPIGSRYNQVIGVGMANSENLRN